MAAHVYNHWCFMPDLAEQHQRMDTFTAPYTVLRLLTHLKMTYEPVKKRAAPFNKIVGERAQTVAVGKQAITRRIRTYVLANNRTEGNAPLTIQTLVDVLQSSRA